MNIISNQEQEQDIFDNSTSGFAIEQQTEELINQVFNRKYNPIYNPSSTIAKEQEYRLLKKKQNKANRHKLQHLTDRTRPNNKIYKNYSQQTLTPSFQQFLIRAQQRWQQHQKWLLKQQQKLQQSEVIQLKEIPDILRGSREKKQPIYQRCIDLQKQKERKFQIQRIQKNKQETQAIKLITFKPTLKTPPKIRQFEEYLAEQQMRQKDKLDLLERRRMEVEVQRLSECTFTPQLVATYNRPNNRIVAGEKVEERLLRSLERPSEKVHCQR